MKIAIISDTHFGDPVSTLVTRDQDGYRLGDRYANFKNAAGTHLDYLVMLGDIFDFSIASYADAYAAGRVFFEQLLKDEITKNVLYVPGNHDADFWHTVEHQVNILMRIENGQPPRPFRWSVPGVIDFDARTEAGRQLNLPEVGRTGGTYGGLFLDKIAPGLTFTFAYPNLYFKVGEDIILLTHGQYLEPYWSLLSEWLLKIAGKDLKIGDSLDLKEMVSLNFPANQLACSGIGQAGKLTDLIRDLQREIKDNDYRRLQRYLDKLVYELDNKTDYPWYKFCYEWVTDALFSEIANALMEAVKDTKATRFDDKFVNDPDVQDRFHTYIKSSLVEISHLADEHDVLLGIPTRMIFGHTHEPIGWNNPESPRTNFGGNVIRWHNTGGWLTRKENGEEHFVGAEVFLCDETNGMRSVRVG